MKKNRRPGEWSDPFPSDGLLYPFYPDDPRFVDAGSTRSRQEYPYGYSPYFIRGDRQSVKGCGAYYSDRLFQADPEKFRIAVGGPSQSFEHYTMGDAQKFLISYFGRRVVCTGIAQGANLSSGHPYWIFFIKENI